MVSEGRRLSLVPKPGQVFVQQLRIASAGNGIVLPDMLEQLSNTGEVSAVGRGVYEVKKGDRIVFDPHAATAFEYRGNQLHRLPASNILALIEP